MILLKINQVVTGKDIRISKGCLAEALTHVMEHEYSAKGLTETVLSALWVVLTKHFLQCYRANLGLGPGNALSVLFFSLWLFISVVNTCLNSVYSLSKCL